MPRLFSSNAEYNHVIKVKMPMLDDDGATTGVVEKWYKKEGDKIKRDDPICDIRTDMVTFGMITDDEDSIMSEILVPEESEPVDPGTVLCITLSKESASDDEEGSEG